MNSYKLTEGQYGFMFSSCNGTGHLWQGLQNSQTCDSQPCCLLTAWVNSAALEQLAKLIAMAVEVEGRALLEDCCGQSLDMFNVFTKS